MDKDCTSEVNSIKELNMLPSAEPMDPIGHCPSYSFAQRKAEQFATFLNALSDAMEYAQDLSCSPWDFALQVDQVMALGIRLNDLRWMLMKDWIQQRYGAPIIGHPNEMTYIEPNSTFIISQLGMEVCKRKPGCFEQLKLSSSWGASQPQNGRSLSKPSWDTERRELSVLGKVVKRFRWPAPNQETILSVFSEEDWPARIEDPLSQGNGLDPKRRLGDTIKCLNRNQQENLIRFRGDGTGEGVLWDFIIPHNECA